MTFIMQGIVNNCAYMGISQRELAKRSGISEVSISRYFTGKRTPNLNDAEKMVNALGLTIILAKKTLR